jgi:hypothetical protein
MAAATIVAAVLAGSLACRPAESASVDSTRAARDDSIALARQDSINRAQPGYIVDSILPIEEALRRFRAGLGAPARELGGGAPSRDALIHAFAQALGSRDTVALKSLLLTRAEFAWLLYPESPYTAPPYRQAPDIVWLQLTMSGSTGFTRLVQRMGGRTLAFRTSQCPDAPVQMGANRLWRNCTVRLDSAGVRRDMRLFGPIIERNGRFKFVNLANDL